MKTVLSVLLIFLSLLMGFQQAIIIMHFKLNQDAIEQQFCINKNEPQLQCNGTCFLRKQLREAESSDLASINIYKRVDMLPVSITKFEAKNSITEIRVKRSLYKEIFYTEPYLEVFVPPPIA